MSGSDEPLFLGHFSLRGTALNDRWAATSAAGFTGISVWWKEYLTLRDAGATAVEWRANADAVGLQLTQLEYFPLLSSKATSEVKAFASEMAQFAAALGCTSVTCVGNSEHGFITPADIDEKTMAKAVTNFGILCDSCAEVGISAAVEVMPYVTAVDTLSRGIDLLQEAARPNGGLILDSYHFFRGDEDWAALARLTAADIDTVQLSDGLHPQVAGPYVPDSLGRRLCPGEGEFDLERFLASLSAFEGTFTTEVLSEDLALLPATTAVTRMAITTRKLLDDRRHSTMQ